MKTSSTYSHTQRNRRVWPIVGTLAAIDVGIILAILLHHPPSKAVLIAPVGCLLLALGAATMMESMTIELRDGFLSWAFGPGWFRRRERAEAIADAYIVETGWLDGWGIHFTRFGWLYNIAGRTAVMLRLRDGRALALGTDDASGLLEAIKPFATAESAR